MADCTFEGAITGTFEPCGLTCFKTFEFVVTDDGSMPLVDQLLANKQATLDAGYQVTGWTAVLLSPVGADTWVHSIGVAYECDNEPANPPAGAV